MRTRWTVVGSALVTALALCPLRASSPAHARARAAHCMLCPGFVEAGAETQPVVPASPPDSVVPAQTAPRPTGGVTIRGRVDLPGSGEAKATALSRAVVYIASDEALDAQVNPVGHVSIAQKTKAFVPNFAVVCRGTNIEFPNWDDFDHNVFSRSKAAPAFDLDRYPKGMSKSRVFEKVGVVQVFCNIHPRMRAIILVTPNAYFTRADENGEFELTNVPPGRYRLVAWAERCEESQQEVEVGVGAEPTLAFTLKESRASALENSPRRDEDYGVERGLGVKRERLNLPVVPDAHPAKDPPPASPR